MTTISVSIDDRMYEEFARLAHERETEPEGMMQLYVRYLLAGGAPVDEFDDIPVSGLMKLAEMGGSFDWLNDEPDIYSMEDGEPV